MHVGIQPSSDDGEGGDPAPKRARSSSVEDARAATRRAASHVLATSAQDQRRRSLTSETVDVERQERSPPRHAMIEVPLAVHAVGKLRAKDRALQTQLTRVGRFGNALRAMSGQTSTAPPVVTPSPRRTTNPTSSGGPGKTPMHLEACGRPGSS